MAQQEQEGKINRSSHDGQIEIRPGSKVDDIADSIVRNITKPILLYNGHAEPWLQITELPGHISSENFNRMMEAPFWRNVVVYDLAESLIAKNHLKSNHPV